MTHPGQYIEESLIVKEGGDWYSVDIASKVGIPVLEFNSLVMHHDRPITEEEAIKFARFLGIKASKLLLMQAEYSLWSFQQTGKTKVAIKG